ncbi:MAG: tRNA dihydrouridine synthase DusB [Betaproteobacteria bacterium]|nr:tRNA dihydrouridine synthase DusB [Betaproteobacteria bacterium]
MRLGAHELRNGLFAAPMAGVTDRPFRTLCRRYGAGLAISEMVSSHPELRGSRKSRLRLEHRGEVGPVSVQIAGADPAMMAAAARVNAAEGAQIIDINMGCPAKKVCNVAAGSALMSDEPLVARILEAVVAAVDVPVTLKIRTGPNPQQRNALRIARIAESAGVKLLAVHGRTRACGFRGEAEFNTIAEVKAGVRIPVIANGDIATPEDARRVLDYTGADGIMIGRAAHGRPWVFREFLYFLNEGRKLPPPAAWEMRAVALEHLDGIYSLYGEALGVRIARKHIGWYTRGLPGGEAFRREANAILSAHAQLAAVGRFFDGLNE